MNDIANGFPRQQLPFSKKTKEWGKKCVDWASARSYFNYAPVRSTAVNKKINYDLISGKIHMPDITRYLNPDDTSISFAPDKIQHFPIMNTKLDVLRGEARSRNFDWRAVVTNMNSVSEIEENRKNEFAEKIRDIVENGDINDQQANETAKDTVDWYSYNWQDIRELRANEILKHYMMKENFKGTFTDGFMDALVCGEEVYLCDVIGGEPMLQKLNPRKLDVYMSGYSSNIEDADVIVYEDYLSPGKIIDMYYDQLKPKEVAWLEGSGIGSELGGESWTDIDKRGFINLDTINGDLRAGASPFEQAIVDSLDYMPGTIGSDLCPYDTVGNVRVLRVFWKSRRKIKKVKHYDPETGEELFDFYPENYILDEAAGEEEQVFWVNEPWEGTKIGDNIYVNVRPRIVRFNTIDNPSRCHFGIIGTIYNVNEGKPFSLVDMMKPYNYLYDAVANRMINALAGNWGVMLEMDLALRPKDWPTEQWLYFAKVHHILMKDSFREGDKGSATGKLAGGLNNASKGMINADRSQEVMNYINLMMTLDTAMSNIVGISPQRLGSISSRETVGGVERSTLQSSYITEWLFQKHDDTIKRVLEAFLEVAKCAFRGRTKSFLYMLSDGSRKMLEVNGDEFSESDYGIVIDNSNSTMKFDQQLDTLAQAAVQNQVMDFASLMKLYSSMSLSEKTRIVENAERRMQERQQAMQEQQAQMQQQMAQMQQQTEMQKLQQQDMINQRDNETKIKVAEINSQAEWLRLGQYANNDQNNSDAIAQKDRQHDADLNEDRRQFDAELAFKQRELENKMDIERKKIEATKLAAIRNAGKVKKTAEVQKKK